MAVKKESRRGHASACNRRGIGRTVFYSLFLTETEEKALLIDWRGIVPGSRRTQMNEEKTCKLEIVNHIADTCGGHIDGGGLVTHEQHAHQTWSIFNSAKKKVFEEGN